MATTTLVCRQCNYENEPERVYCHNCGAKLDRSLLPPEAVKREDPVVVQERVKKMIKPRGVSVWHRIKNFATCLIVSILLAAIIVIAQAPADTPNLSKEAMMEAPTVFDDLEAAQQLTGSHRLAYTTDQVNAFLQSSLRGKDPASGGAMVKFERAFVHFDEGLVTVTTQESILGFSIYATTIRSVNLQNGTVTSQPRGGSFGRLQIPGKLLPFVESAFSPLWKVLDHGRKLVSQLQSITFHKGSVEMITKPTPVAAAAQ